RPRQSPDEVLLVTNLAYRHSGGRRCGGDSGGPGRPALFREHGCCRRRPFPREGCFPPPHYGAASSPIPASTQLFYEIIFLQTPDDRCDSTSGYTVTTVACIANEQFGVEDGLGFSGISWRGHWWHLRDMCRRGQRGLLSDVCQRGQSGQNDKNAE